MSWRALQESAPWLQPAPLTIPRRNNTTLSLPAMPHVALKCVFSTGFSHLGFFIEFCPIVFWENFGDYILDKPNA